MNGPADGANMTRQLKILIPVINGLSILAFSFLSPGQSLFWQQIFYIL